MTRINWGTPDHIFYRSPDYAGVTIGLTAYGTAEVDTDDAAVADHLKQMIIMQLKMGIAKYSDSTTLSELQSKCPELNAAVSDAVTKSLGMSCTVKIASITPDEESQKIMNDMDRMKKMSDPAYAQAEMERAMKEAEAAAKKAGITDEQIREMANAPIEIPPEMQKNLAMAQAISEQNRQAAPRPKFCGNCGSALAGGRFCPNCGKPV